MKLNYSNLMRTALVMTCFIASPAWAMEEGAFWEKESQADRKYFGRIVHWKYQHTPVKK